MADFAETIISWYRENKRELPWRNTEDPYLIWVSEIILQQTRVESGKAYYERFTERFPNLVSLAAADLSEVLKIWQGLGYYTRARNMHQTARILVEQNQGSFPADYESLKKLKGIGDYTAAAISSFSFRLVHPVVDGNVFRVLSRFFGLKYPIDSSAGKKFFLRLAGELIDKDRPDLFNQAIMEFGALQCIPLNPFCSNCPLSEECVALNTGAISALPVKARKQQVRNRYFHYLHIVLPRNQTIVSQRNGKDIWHSLFEFPLIEAEKKMTIRHLMTNRYFQELKGNTTCEVLTHDKEFVHLLTHQKIHARFFRLIVSGKFHADPKFQKVYFNDLHDSLPIHRLMQRYLNSLNQYWEKDF